MHGIYVHDDNLLIPFHLQGSTSYFTTRLPTDQEKRDSGWIIFTSEREWDPTFDKFRDVEDAMRSHHGMKSLEYVHYNHEGEEIDERKLCSVAIISK